MIRARHFLFSVFFFILALCIFLPFFLIFPRSGELNLIDSGFFLPGFLSRCRKQLLRHRAKCSKTKTATDSEGARRKAKRRERSAGNKIAERERQPAEKKKKREAFHTRAPERTPEKKARDRLPCERACTQASSPQERAPDRSSSPARETPFFIMEISFRVDCR